MSEKANIIELNGKRYDVATGKIAVGHSKPVVTAQKLASKHIDGFVGPSNAVIKQLKPTQTVVHETAKAATTHNAITHQIKSSAVKSFDIHRTTAAPATRHQAQHSKTLMRKSVHRPSPSLKRHTKAATRTDTLVKKPKIDFVPKHSYYNVSIERLERASRISKNKMISKFGGVQTAAHAAMNTSSSLATAAAVNHTVAAHPQAVVQLAPATTKSVNSSTDVFEQALRHANSHTQSTPHHPKNRAKSSKRTKRLTSFAAVGIAVVVLSGFIILQNASNIQLQLASSKAGIHATLPSWKPEGFNAGKFSYSPGSVAIAFHNNDNASFSLVQTSSNWDSQALLDDFVSSASASYDTIKAAGRTVYTYGDNNATWVNGGIWYRVTTNGSLSNSQVIKLASSI